MSSMPGRSGLGRMVSEGTLPAGLAVVFFINLFLPWGPSQICFGGPLPAAPTPYSTHAIIMPPFGPCGLQTGLGGAGSAAAILALALLLWEALRLARLSLMLSAAYRSLISMFLCGAVLVFTILDLIPRFGSLVSNPGEIPFAGAFAWVGLGLALLIAAVGLVHWRIWQAEAPAGSVPASPLAWGGGAGAATPAPAACPGCGLALLAGAHFCSHCGQAVPG
ncbi:MAG: hypothetical protein ACYCZN_05475 [Candidatus Dormibacteria bacterium]